MRLDIGGDNVAEANRPKQGIPIMVDKVLDRPDGQNCGQAMVAAAGGTHCRKLGPAHPGIGRRRGEQAG